MYVLLLRLFGSAYIFTAPPCNNLSISRRPLALNEGLALDEDDLRRMVKQPNQLKSWILCCITKMWGPNSVLGKPD